MNIDKAILINSIIFYKIPIHGLEKYSISKCGMIYSKHINRIIKPRKDRDGYQIITFARHKKRLDMKLHRVIALTFIGPCPNGYVCNHINTIKDDNRIENLEWISQKQNYHHSKNMKEKDFYNPKKWMGEKHGHTKLTDKQAVQIRKNYEIKKETFKDIAVKYKVSSSCIARLLKNETYRNLLKD